MVKLSSVTGSEPGAASSNLFLPLRDVIERGSSSQAVLRDLGNYRTQWYLHLCTLVRHRTYIGVHSSHQQLFLILNIIALK